VDAVASFDELLKLSAGQKRLSSRQQREIELWKTWKASGENREDFAPLLQSFQPLLQKRIRVFSGRTPLPPAAVEAEFNKRFLHAARTYDPNRGAKLSTHVQNQLKSAQRFITRYQNVGRIPEPRAYNIGKFTTARGELEQKFKRPASSMELADRLQWNLDEVHRMEAELSHGDLPTSGFLDDPTVVVPSREREVLKLLQFELTPDERVVYEHLLGSGGRPSLSATQIAKKMGWSDSKVSRIRAKIAKKAQKTGLA
jgi:DNA-directed RNA polymerase specialized sigma subunit